MSTPSTAESLIRTPDQRLRVFVSSTLAELAEERAAVARAITSLGLAPVMFELGARPHPPQGLYRAYLAQSDIFIGLYWQSYGWVGPGMDISGLEDEFRLSGGRPRLLYLKAPAPERQPQLTAMIDEIRSQGTDAYRTFRSARELARLVRDDLVVLLSERFASSAPETAATTPAPRRTLPVTSTSLVGRESDVEAVSTLLERPDVRLVTLTGPGGIGKTRLAIAVGEDIVERLTIPVTFVPLEALTSASDVIPRIAAEAGVVLEGTRSARDSLVEYLADRTEVFVLDNLEQVTGAAAEVEDLLARSPGIKIVATSRAVLRLRAEHEYIVEGLSSGSGSEPLGADLPAVRLFIDRADAVRRGIRWTAENTAASVEICRRLDGVPLAIELAAARTRLLDPVALLGRLETVLDSLGTGPVDLPERQRTLRATIQWSVGLLTDAERRLLTELSVFAGGWSLDAGAAVSGGDEDATLDALDALAGHSLVSVDASGGEPRFRMLTTVAAFAAELAGGEFGRDEIERRHAEYFAALIDTDDVPADLTTPWADRLRVEEENVRVAIEWFFRHEPSRLPHLLRSMWLFWQTNDRLIEGRQWVTELEALTGTLTLNDRDRAELLFTQAVTAVAVGDDSGAVAAVQEIPAMIPLVEESALRNALQLAASWSLPIMDDFDGALVAASAAYDGFSEHDDAFIAFAALTVGMLQTALGDDDDARRFLREADELGTRFGNRWPALSARTQLAILDLRSGDLESARRHLRDCLDEIRDDQVGTITACFILTTFAELAVAEAKPREAATALGAVKGLRVRAGLLAWPIARRGEAALRDRVAALLEPQVMREAHELGAELRAHDALALVRLGTA